MGTMDKIWDWVYRNKEGMIIGAVIAFIMTQPGLYTYILGFFNKIGWFNQDINKILVIVSGIGIGALLDSILHPKL